MQRLVVTGDAHRRRGAGFDAGKHRISTIEAADLLAERRQRFADRLDCILGQRRRQIAQAHARFVGGLDIAERGRWYAANEVADQLRGCAVIAATQLISARFQALLQLHAGQRVAGEILLRVDAYHDARVGIAFVARVLAHAIGHHAAWLGGGGNHGTAGAHAEAVDRTAILGVIHQLVVGGAEFRVAGVLAQPGLVDHALRVFDAETDGKRLGLDEHALAMQHAHGIAGAVPQRQHHMATLDRLAAGQHYAFELAIVDHEIGHFALEAHFAAEGDNLLAHGRDHTGEPEGADVRLAHIHDLGRCAGTNELVHNLARVELGVLDLAVELAVGEQPGAALAELHVGFRRQDLLAPQRPGVLGTAAHILAALEHDGLEAHLCEQQRGEQSAGAEAHHQRSLAQIGWRLAYRVVIGVWRWTHVVVIGKTRQDRRLVAGLQIDDVDEQNDAVLLARIVAALEYGEIQQIGVADVQAFDDGLAQLIGGMIEGQGQLVDANHGGNPGR